MVLERRSFPEANCLLASFEKDCSFFEVRITSLALTRKIITSARISEGDYSLSQGSVLECLKFARVSKLEIAAV